MNYILIKSETEIPNYISAFAREKIIACDIETTGLDPHTDRIRLIQFAAEGMPVLIFDCFHFLPGGLSIIKEILENPTVKIFQNAKFDLQFFMALGIETARINVFDTMLAGQLLRTSGGPGRVNLAALCAHYLNEELPKDEQKSVWTGELSESQLNYAARDAEILVRLRVAMVKIILENNLSNVAKIEFACAHAVAEMEYAGVSIDADKWRRLTAQTETERDGALKVLYSYSGEPTVQMNLWGEDEIIGNNFDSNKYILRLLKQNGIETDATSKRVLSSHAGHPLITALTAYRKASKALAGFLYPIPKMISPATGRLHPRYGQIGAWSGRMSCGGPNIQQIPRDNNFRECFVSQNGKLLVAADYSQIELRVAARISGDMRMTEAYKMNEDLHALTASLVSDIDVKNVTKAERQAAKAVNFGLIFGMGAVGLMNYARQSYGTEMTLETAEKFRENFFRAYPGIARWHREIKNGKPEEERTLAGRKFIFNDGAGFSGRYNMPVQGTAADIMKASLGRLAKKTARGYKIIAAVHDEIILETDEKTAAETAVTLKNIMEGSGNEILSGVPVAADARIMKSWGG